MADLDLDARRMAVLVIDLQKGVVGLPTAPHAPAAVLQAATGLIGAARDAGAKVVLVHVGAAADGGDRLRPLADAPMRPGPVPPDWSEIVPEIGPKPDDLVILKRQWGAFYGTDLDLQLRRRAITTLVLCGIATEFGVESTARDAYERGYGLIFAADAMSGLTREGHENALTRIFPRIGRVRETGAIIGALRP